MKKGKRVTGKYYKDMVLKKLKTYSQIRRPVMSFKHLRLLHDNAPVHICTSVIITISLQNREGNSLTIPYYSQDLAPFVFFLFSEIVNLHHWTEISVQTGAWDCRTPEVQRRFCMQSSTMLKA